MSDVFLFDSYYNNLPQVGAPYCMVMAANFVCHCFAGDEHSFLFINELCDESFSRCVRVCVCECVTRLAPNIFGPFANH